MNNNCGIYKITCQSNNGFEYIYIGQAQKISARWVHHKSSLNNNSHRNKKIQSVANKYGLGQLAFEIVEICEIEELNDKEMYYIKVFNTYDTKHGLNLTQGGSGPSGFKASSATKQKMSDSHKERYAKHGHHCTGRKLTVDQIKQRTEQLSKSKYSQRGEAHPFYKRVLSEEEIDRLRQARSKTMSLISPDGNIITFKGCNKFCDDNKLDKNKFYELKRGEIAEYKGYKLTEEDKFNLKNK